jgi:hypothetical protein
MARLTKWKPPLFYQYLISYIVILCMPIMVAGYVIYSHFVGIMEKQVMKDNQSMLLQIKDSVDMQMRQLHSISVQISSKPELTPYSLRNFYDVFKAKSLLNYTSCFFTFVEANTCFQPKAAIRCRCSSTRNMFIKAGRTQALCMSWIH